MHTKGFAFCAISVLQGTSFVDCECDISCRFETIVDVYRHTKIFQITSEGFLKIREANSRSMRLMYTFYCKAHLKLSCNINEVYRFVPSHVDDLVCTIRSKHFTLPICLSHFHFAVVKNTNIWSSYIYFL